jgi:hypothetical protein
MRIITSDPQPGYRTCQRPRLEDPDWPGVALPEDCPVYVSSEPVDVVTVERIFTFADGGATMTPGGVMPDMPERSIIEVRPADGVSPECPACGWETCSFSLAPRVKYPKMHAHGGPDELVRRQRAGLSVVAAEAPDDDLEQRRVAALEQANALKARELALLEQRNGTHEGVEATLPASTPDSDAVPASGRSGTERARKARA